MALTKSQVRSVFGEVYAAEFAFVPPEERIDYTFSPAFCAKMDTAIARHKQSLQHRRVLRRCLVVAAAIVLALLLLVSCSPRLRSATANFWVAFQNGTASIDVTSDPRGQIESVYTLGHVPEGFTQVSFEQPSPRRTERNYRSPNGDSIVFAQAAAQFAFGTVSAENMEVFIAPVDGMDVVFAFSSHLSTARWVYDGYSMQIRARADLDRETLETMIRSLQLAP